MRKRILLSIFMILVSVILSGHIAMADTQPPGQPVKLIFIHHSVGEDWLADENGGLGKSLGENNYFVSDTYYGWGPDGIGDRTDIPDWIEWFAGPNRDTYLRALYSESGGNAAGYEYYRRPMKDPGGENEIVVFKSCYPNSELEGGPDDPPGNGPDMTVAGAKYVYNQILQYFSEHPEKLFIAITPPPSLSKEYASQAEAFSRWMTTEWLSDYQGKNVGVFDLHAVLSGPDNHHTASGEEITYITGHGNTIAYPTEDAHPSAAGNRKATEEFVPLLNYYYNRWRGGLGGSDLVTADLKEEPLTDVAAEPSPVGMVTPGSAGMEIQEEAGEEQTDSILSGEWVTYYDDTSSITLVSSSSSEVCIETMVIPGGWATLETLYASPRDWSGYSGISFHIASDKPDLPYGIVLYAMSKEDGKTGYHKSLSASPDGSGETVTVPFADLSALGGTGAFDPAKAMGLFFSFGSESEEEARVCISDLILVS